MKEINVNVLIKELNYCIGQVRITMWSLDRLDDSVTDITHATQRIEHDNLIISKDDSELIFQLSDIVLLDITFVLYLAKADFIYQDAYLIRLLFRHQLRIQKIKQGI